VRARCSKASDGDLPGSLNDFSDNATNLQFTSRTKQRPSRGWTSELNILSGDVDVDNFDLIKTGVTGDINGKLRYQKGDWLTHDVSGRLSGNVAHSNHPIATEQLDTQDLSNQLDGTLALLADSRRGSTSTMGSSAAVSKPCRGPIPTAFSCFQTNRTDNDQLNMTLRFRQSSDRYVGFRESVPSEPADGDLQLPEREFVSGLQHRRPVSRGRLVPRRVVRQLVQQFALSEAFGLRRLR
jgi:hypothetical protein